MTDNPWAGTIRWLRRLVSQAIGRGTPEEGMRASAILLAVTLATNLIPGGIVVTIVLDIILFFLLLYNFIRYLWRRWR